jgi:hypothetical protein
MLRNTLVRNSEARKASQAMSSLAATTSIHQHKPKLRLAYKASKVQPASPVTHILADRNMTCRLKKIMGISRLWPRTLSEDLVSPLGTTWRT